MLTAISFGTEIKINENKFDTDSPKSFLLISCKVIRALREELNSLSDPKALDVEINADKNKQHQS